MQTLEVTRSYTQPERPTVFSLRSSAVAEIILSLVILLLLDSIMFDRTRYFDVNPHPFWLIVLFISCKYGTREGIIAASACSIALLFGNMPDHSIAQDEYAYMFSVLKLPLLWILSAVAFGELRMMHINERNALENRLKESEEREQSIAGSYQRVKTLKDQLELRMAGQLRSSIAAYQAARSMETLSPNDVIKGIRDLVSASLSPDQFSVYSLLGNRLDVDMTHGWQEEDEYTRSFGPDSNLYQAIVARQQTLCVANSDHERILADQAVLAGPLLDKESGQVIGMLKIERMNLSDLNLSNIEAFASICDWATMSIVNANKYQVAKQGSIINPDHNLFTYNYFTRYTDYMRSLAERLSFDVSMIAIKLTNSQQFDDSTRSQIARVLSESVDNVLRKVDLAFDHQETNDEYSIVLPTTNRQGAQIVVDKIRKSLDKSLEKSLKNANFSFTVQTVYEKRTK